MCTGRSAAVVVIAVVAGVEAFDVFVKDDELKRVSIAFVFVCMSVCLCCVSSRQEFRSGHNGCVFATVFIF